MKKILTIAGSDSGGGAGIQADLKTITVLGGYGASVITALTAQNTQGVEGVLETPVEFIRAQMDAVCRDISFDAAKTGMLAGTKVVEGVAQGIKDYKLDKVVVDPVMVATSGDRLLAQEAVEAVKAELLPLAFMVTPNLYEASILCGFEVENMEGMKEAAREIHKLGPELVLIKGGHLEEEPGRVVDLLFDDKSFRAFEGPRIKTPNTHGTGCTLSSALAVFLAQGAAPAQAVAQAREFMTAALTTSLSVGRGSGPVNHFAALAMLQEKERVLEELRAALDRLLSQPLGRLIPEIRSNFGFALPGAVNPQQVAAVPGRISQIGDRLVSFSQPAFGASQHVAKVILAALRHDPRSRSAMVVRYSREALEACGRAGLKLASFDRADEPPEVKEREGSSLEWGTGEALKGLDHTPDGIFDEGEKGKEPVIRILGRTPLEVVEKVLALAGQMNIGND